MISMCESAFFYETSKTQLFQYINMLPFVKNLHLARKQSEAQILFAVLFW